MFDTITRDTFDGIEVELPSLVEQKVVASILRDLDDKIEVNNEINKNLCALVQIFDLVHKSHARLARERKPQVKGDWLQATAAA